MISGKLFGGLIGFFSFGPIGAAVGIFVGHMFDKSFRQLRLDDSPEVIQAIQLNFFETTFTLIGYLAKVDGRVSEEEIAQTQQLMDNMGLTANHKREAIRLFKLGSAQDFDPYETLDNFRATCGKRTQLVQMLIVYLLNTAMADGDFDSDEEAAIRNIARQLNFSSLAFEQLVRMTRAQGSFSGGSYHGYQRNHQQERQEAYQNANALADAYKALGVDATASDRDIKKAYRKLMSEYHPDKLMGQGVPEDMVKVATERSQEVQAAYDLIKRSRK